MPVVAPQNSGASTLRRINFTIADRQRVRPIDSRLLRRIIKNLLSELLLISHADLAIHLVTAPEITKLNEFFLHHAGATDVITFDYSDHITHNKQRASLMQGEIFVCVDEAVAQARRFRTTWQCELVRYIIHGILHLLGFDDLNPVARRRMKRAENFWLHKLTRRFPLTKLARQRVAI